MKVKLNFLRTVAGILCMSIMVSQFAVITSFFETPKTEQKADKESDSTQIEQFKPQTIAPNYDFSFEAIVPVFVSNVPNFVFLENTRIKSSLPSFINTYLANLFEHHIAINAP